MKALIQRVSEASVTVDHALIASIDHGLVVLLGIEKGDQVEDVKRLLHKVAHYRIFADAVGKMNLNVQQVGGALLVVSQFTLAAETHKGLRPGFSSAAAPDIAQQLYLDFIHQAQDLDVGVETGCFGADMKVALVNDGPVTFWLSS